MCYSILVEQDLKSLEKDLQALSDWNAFSRYKRLGEADPKTFKPLQANERIYPNYFAPIIVNKQDKRRIFPMRYRLRPAHSESEVPSKYNLFNARLDGLLNRQSWKSIIGKQHGILVFKGFFEWVSDAAGKKKVVYFSDPDQSVLVSPVIYDIWVASDNSQGFASFAVITREPFQDVKQAGHDRSPIVLGPEAVDEWLATPFKSPQSAHDFLEAQLEERPFDVRDAAP